jgi:hypothetical protein
MCLCLYEFARRRTDAACAAIALLFPVFTYVVEEATFARGYGLMLGFAGLALMAWQRAAEGGAGRAKWLALLAAAIAGTVSCHYYGAYVAGAIGLGELARLRAAKRLDGGVAAALALGLTPLAVYLPLIRSAAGKTHTFWVPSSVSNAYEAYTLLFAPAVLLLILWMCVVASEENFTLRGGVDGKWPLHEAVAVITLAAMPAVLGVVSEFADVPSYKRYVQPAVMGFAILLTVVFHRTVGGSSRARRLGLAAVVYVGFVPWGLTQMARFWVLPAPATVALRGLEPVVSAARAEAGPIVIDNQGRFLILHHYAPPELRARLVQLSNPEATLKYLGSDTAVRSLALMNQIEPMQLVDYRSFVREHAEFLVVNLGPESWVLQALKADGAELKLERYEKAQGPFAEELTMFRAHMPQTQLSADQAGRSN